jgi:hypothetical protein
MLLASQAWETVSRARERNINHLAKAEGVTEAMGEKRETLARLWLSLPTVGSVSDQ